MGARLAAAPNPRFGLIGRHWRGELPAWAALGLVLIAGRILIALIWVRLPAPLPRPVFALALAADAAVALWQMVGAWRSIARGLDAEAQRLTVYAARLAVVLALPVTVNGWIDHLAAQVPLPKDVAAPVLPLPVENGTALLAGDIDYAALARFEKTPPGSFTTLRLDSPGGMVFAARALAQRVAARGLSTEVEGDCLSACTLVFLAADSRSLGPRGRLGFHGYALLDPAPSVDIAAEEARDRGYLISRGLSPDFVTRVMATPNSAMWFPDRATLAAAGVLR